MDRRLTRQHPARFQVLPQRVAEMSGASSSRHAAFGRVTGVGSGIAVSIEESSPAERVDLFARCFALTTGERELLGHLVEGNDTKQVARTMFLSQHTVQDHLKSIFAKASTHSRKTLLSRVLGL